MADASQVPSIAFTVLDHSERGPLVGLGGDGLTGRKPHSKFSPMTNGGLAEKSLTFKTSSK